MKLRHLRKISLKCLIPLVLSILNRQSCTNLVWNILSGGGKGCSVVRPVTTLQNDFLCRAR
jgi:hypothetical protein